MKLATFTFTAAVIALPATALAETYVLDATHTHVGFSISHLGFSDTYGNFEDVAGTLELDEKKPEEARLEVTVQTKSLDSGHGPRDEHVTGKDFLSVEKFPTMIFKSTKITRTGDTTADVTGDLTLHGVTKPLTLKVTLNKLGENPMSKKVMAGFSATGTLKRSDLGITTYLPAIGDDVTLMISSEAVRR
jgi:polyisoprenoid-binding protein YceI